MGQALIENRQDAILAELHDLDSKEMVATGKIRQGVIDLFDIWVARGKLLAEVKESLPHGSFMPWIKQHTSYSHQMANRYMRAYKYRDEVALKQQIEENGSLTTIVDQIDKKLVEQEGGAEVIPFDVNKAKPLANPQSLTEVTKETKVANLEAMAKVLEERKQEIIDAPSQVIEHQGLTRGSDALKLLEWAEHAYPEGYVAELDLDLVVFNLKGDPRDLVINRLIVARDKINEILERFQMYIPATEES